MNNLLVYLSGYYPFENFSPPHQNQKESEQSHLGNLNYIFFCFALFLFLFSLCFVCLFCSVFVFVFAYWLCFQTLSNEHFKKTAFKHPCVVAAMYYQPREKLKI